MLPWQIPERISANPPHPNVEGPITFDPTYLGAVTGFAGAIDDASRQFLATKSAAID